VLGRYFKERWKMKLESTGRQIDSRELEVLERDLGTALSATYREFLMAFNGGVPTPNIIDVPGFRSTPTDVQVFFGIGRRVESSNLSWNLSLISERYAGFRMLPVACDSGGNLFCLRLDRGVAEEVVYCDLESNDGRVFPVAARFSEFVQSLREF
jgi:hypothetical protein